MLSGKIESELAGLSDDEAREFRRELGIERSGLDDSIVEAYELLGLMTFLTAGEKEARAWTIERGTQGAAGGRQDSQRHRARLHPGRDRLVRRLRAATARMEALRAAGQIRSEGKEYVMREGDVVEFPFNV